MAAMTQSEYARHAGVNRSTVHRWLEAGRIQARPDGLIDPMEADRMREATESPLPHHQARKAQIDAEKAAAASAGPGPYQPTTQAPATQHGATAGQQDAIPAVEKIGAALKLETYKLQKAKAEQANMDLDKMAGALVERAEVDFVMADFGATARAIHDGFANRYAHELAGMGVPSDKAVLFLEGLGKDASKELAEHMNRKMEQIAQ